MKISTQLSTGPLTLGPLHFVQNDQRISVCLVGDTPIKIKKYATLLCRELDGLFFVTVNPPPEMLVDLGDGFGPSALTCLTLQKQWEWITSKWQGNQAFNLRSLYNWFEDLVIVPERTAAGLIHFHCIARLREGKIDSDISRFFWSLFDVNCTSSAPGAIKRFNEITKAMVKVVPIKDDLIVEYLFDKDKKDYETIMDFKVGKSYPFQPLRLFYYDEELEEP